MNLFASVTTDFPTTPEAVNVWVVVLSVLLPYVLRWFFPKLPIPDLPGPKPAPDGGSKRPLVDLLAKWFNSLPARDLTPEEIDAIKRMLDLIKVPAIGGKE